MAAVAAGRKDDWLALFAPDAIVEDPVGPSPLDPEGKGHHGHAGIREFWDRNFGAVSRFHFQVKDSFANGPCCANLVTITMWLGEARHHDDGRRRDDLHDQRRRADHLDPGALGTRSGDGHDHQPGRRRSSRWPTGGRGLGWDPQRQVPLAVVLLVVIGAPGVQQLGE